MANTLKMFFWRNLSYLHRAMAKKQNNDNNEEMNGVEGEQERRRSCPNISYDISLPVQHTYLGNDLEELSGRTVLDDNSCQTIPLLTLPGVVLVPGQTLPLQLFHPATVSMMMHIINSDRTFGLINSRFSGRVFGNSMDPIGTTAEIRSYSEESNDSYGLVVLRIKAEGRQRFQVLDTRRQPDGMVVGKVHILPELSLGDPGDGIRLSSLNRFRLPPPRKHQTDDMKNRTSPTSLTTKKHLSRYNFSDLTHWPSFVYKQFDPEVLMQKIKVQLQGWNESLKTEYMPSEAQEFSYWVAANLPLDDSHRLGLLAINNDIQRLRRELQILEQYVFCPPSQASKLRCSILRCRDCNAHVADQKDIFSMSLQGPQGTYVNPNGYVHEAITLYNAKGLLLMGRASTEQSWFPGYAWRICECENCRSHMGWKFISVNKKLQPAKFWALCRASLTADMIMKEEEDET